MKEVVSGLSKKIRRVPDFPKKGIIFWDMTTLFKDSQGLKNTVDAFVEYYKDKNIDCIASIESRGFIIGSVLAYLLGKGFILIRKKGKLPYDTIEESYVKEYGADTIEMHKDGIEKGDKVLIIDDLLATGDTASAACRLVERLGGEIVGCAFIVELIELAGRKKLRDYSVFSLIQCKEDE
ncbi:adenine phosphoribosyltransferase [Candidatus Dojkabacteria bacterium]|nr:adenine phosphoribosyltransferase [Candidatus Dojkabacteria bacterium]